MLTGGHEKRVLASLMVLLMLASGESRAWQASSRERLALDLPAQFPWRTEHDEGEGVRSWEHDPVAADTPFGPIEVSATDTAHSPFPAREYSERLHALFSSYSDKLQLVTLERGKDSSGYWEIYEMREKGAASPAVLGYVRQGKTAVHTVVMELHDEVGRGFVDQWVGIFSKSKLVDD